MQPFALRLAHERPLVLDGATGSELHRRGVDTALPLWSAAALLAPRDSGSGLQSPGTVLHAIHTDYVNAGAELITANTFRCHARNLAHAGLADQAGELTRRAVQWARDAAAGRAYVAGSQAPLEDCYRPDLVPGDDALGREHAEMARHLADAGVDVILVETQNTVRESAAAARAAQTTGLPLLVSFVCGVDGRLLSGETLAEAVAAVLPAGPLALLINCTPAESTLAALLELRRAAPDVPCGAYANIGHPDPVQGWINTDAQQPDVYAALAEQWLAHGANLVGGCCGTGPAHIAAICRRVGEWLERR